jgi:uncharacterized membrane protein YqjE
MTEQLLTMLLVVVLTSMAMHQFHSLQVQLQHSYRVAGTLTYTIILIAASTVTLWRVVKVRTSGRIV